MNYKETHDQITKEALDDIIKSFKTKNIKKVAIKLAIKQLKELENHKND